MPGNEVRIRVTAQDDTDRVLRTVERKFRDFASRMKTVGTTVSARADIDQGSLRSVETQLDRRLRRMRASAVKVAVKPDSDQFVKDLQLQIKRLAAAKQAGIKIPVKPEVDQTFTERTNLIAARFGRTGTRSGLAFMAGFLKVVTFGQVGGGFSTMAAKLAPKMAGIGAVLGGALATGLIAQATNLLTAGLPLVLGSAMLALPIVGLVKPMVDAQKEIDKINLKIATKQNALIEANERVREASNKKQRAAALERVRDIKEEIAQLQKGRRELEKRAEPLERLSFRFKHFVAEVSKPVKVPLLATMKLIGDQLRDWEKPVKEAFAELAPALKPFTEGVLGGIEQFFKAIGKEMPGIKAGMEAWGRVMPQIGKTFGDFIATILRDPEKTERALQNFAGALDDVAEAAGNIINWLQDAADAYGNFAREIDEAENAGAEELGKAIVAKLDELDTKIDEKLKEIHDTFAKWWLEGGLSDELAEAFSYENMKSLYDAIHDRGDDFYAAIREWFTDLPRENEEDTKKLYEWWWNLGKGSVDSYEEGLDDEGSDSIIWTAIGKMFQRLWDRTKEWWKNLGKESVKSYEEGVEEEETSDSLIWNAIKAMFKKAADKIKDWAKNTWKDAKQSFIDGHRQIIEDVEGFKNKIVNKFNSLKDRTVNKVKDLWKDAKQSFKENHRQVISDVEGFKDKVVAKFESLKDRVKQKAKALKDGFIDRMKELVQSAKEQAGKVKSGIENKFDNAKDWLFKEGKDILNGLLDGMKDRFDRVKKWVSGIAKWIKDHKGPVSMDRQLLVPAGKALMGGLLEGLKFGFGGVGDFVYGAATSVKDIINKIKDTMFLGDWSGKIGSLKGGGNKLLNAIMNTFGIRGGTYPGHGERGASKAWDFMARGRLGDMIASFAKTFAKQLGVMYIIWNKRIWSVARKAEGWRPYTRYGSSGTPSQMHTNHVHVSLFDRGGVLRPGRFALNMSGLPERILSPSETKSFDRLVKAASHGGAGGNTYITINAPNYVGSQDDLRRTLVDMNRRGQLEVIRLG